MGSQQIWEMDFLGDQDGFQEVEVSWQVHSVMALDLGGGGTLRVYTKHLAADA